jgi:hypothetical protein
MPDVRSYMESRAPCQQRPRFAVCASQDQRLIAQPSPSMLAQNGGQRHWNRPTTNHTRTDLSVQIAVAVLPLLIRHT